MLEDIYARWSQGDFDLALGEQFSIALDPDFPDTGVHSGLEGVAAYMRNFLEPWERLTITAEDMIEAEEKVVVRVLQVGIGKASGIPVELRYFHVWSFDGSAPTQVRSVMHEAEALAMGGTH